MTFVRPLSTLDQKNHFLDLQPEHPYPKYEGEGEGEVAVLVPSAGIAKVAKR